MRVRDVAFACAILCTGFAATRAAVVIVGGEPPALIGSALAASANPATPGSEADERALEQLGRDLDRLGREAGRDAQKKLDQALDEVGRHLQALRAAGIAGWKEALEAYRRSLRESKRAEDETEI